MFYINYIIYVKIEHINIDFDKFNKKICLFVSIYLRFV